MAQVTSEREILWLELLMLLQERVEPLQFVSLKSRELETRRVLRVPMDVPVLKEIEPMFLTQIDFRW
jgi:hypothetical protein